MRICMCAVAVCCYTSADATAAPSPAYEEGHPRKPGLGTSVLWSVDRGKHSVRRV
jgi:hypothetical protein